MNRLPTLCAIVFLVAAFPPVLNAQQDSIPNSGFEQWTSGDPDGWLTTNAPPDIINVTQSADAHSGNLAMRGEVVDFSGFPIQPSLVAASSGEAGIPVSQRWAAVRGFYKMNPDSGDRFAVDVLFLKNSSVIAAGGFVDSNDVLSYQEFVVNMTYFTGDTPDTAMISLSIVGPNGPDMHVGSVMIVDDISFSDVPTTVQEQAVQRPVDFGLSNYPNPFNPSTTISYSLPQRGAVRLELFNLLGQPVRRLVEGEQAAGAHSVVWDGTDDRGKPLSSGVYFYRLQSREFSAVNKMLLLK